MEAFTVPGKGLRKTLGRGHGEGVWKGRREPEKEEKTGRQRGREEQQRMSGVRDREGGVG